MNKKVKTFSGLVQIKKNQKNKSSDMMPSIQIMRSTVSTTMEISQTLGLLVIFLVPFAFASTL